MLNLANCRLDVRGIGLLAKAMPIFQNLEILYLYNNVGIGSRESTNHSEAFRAEPFRRQVTPEKSELNHSEGKAVAFAEARPNPGTGSERAGSSVSSAVTSLVDFTNSLAPTLRQLSLGSCALGTKLGVAVLSNLQGRVGFQELDLSDNDFRENDLLIDAIRHFLKTSPSITKLGLALNALGNSGASTVARVLAATSQEITVDLAANNVSSEIQDAILCPRQTRSPSKETGDGAKTTIEKVADALALELNTSTFPIRGRLLI